MTATEIMVKSALNAEAETVTLAPHLRDGIYNRARRYRVRRALTVGGGAIAVASVAVTAALALSDRTGRPDRSRPASVAAQQPAGFESWNTRGDLAGDTAFIDSAVQTWAFDRDSEPRPHTQVHVLWAGHLPTGRAAVLLGTDQTGVRRLAVVGGAGRQLFTTRDMRAPVTLTHLSFNLFTDAESSTPSGYRDALVVVLAPGSTDLVRWFDGLAGGSTGVRASAEVTAADGIASIDISASGPTGRPTIQIVDASDEIVYDGPIGAMS